MKAHRAPTSTTQTTAPPESSSGLPEQDSYGNNALSSWLPASSEEEASSDSALFGEQDPMGLGFNGFGGDSVEMLAANIGSIEALGLLSAELGADMIEQVLAYLVANRREFLISMWATSPYSPLISLIAPKVHVEVLVTALRAHPPEQIAHIMHGLDAAGLQWYAVAALLAMGAGALTVLPLLKSGLVEATWAQAPDAMQHRACEALEQHWPAGLGFDFAYGLGATFGVPIHLGYDHTSTINHLGGGNFKVTRRGVVDRALDVGAGAGAYVNDYQAGFGLAAGLQAGIAMSLEQEYRFPTRDSSAFTALLKYAIGTTGLGPLGLLDRLSALIDEGSVSPRDYLTRTKVERATYLGGQVQGTLGVKTGPKEDRTATWTSNEGAPDMGQTSDPSLGKVGGYLDRLVRSFVECRLDGDLSLAQKLGIEVRQTAFEEGEDGRTPTNFEIEAFAEGSGAEELTQRFPGLLQHLSLPTLPEFNLGLGIRATWKATWAPGADLPTIMPAPVVSLYGSHSGEGTRDQASIDIDTTPGTYSSAERFLSSASAAHISRRIQLAAPLGQRFLSTAKKQASLRTLLPEDYAASGFTLDGHVDIGATLSAAMIKTIWEAVLTGTSAYTGPEGLQRLHQDTLLFFSTGVAPPALLAQLETIADAFLSGIERANLHVRFGAGIVAGASAANGATYRGEFNANVGATYDLDLLASNDGTFSALTTQDIKNIFTGRE